MFGWCMARQHVLCPAKFQRWVWAKQKVGRVTTETIVYLDEYHECSCHCHRKAKK